MPSEEILRRDIVKILTNGFGKDPKTKKECGKLSKEQLKTLKEYKEWYENKPSSKGGTTKITTLWNVLCELRQIGLFIKKPFEKASKEDFINWVKYQRGKYSEATISSKKVTLRSFYRWMYGITKKGEFPKVVDDPILEPQKVKTTRTPDMLLNKDEIRGMIEKSQKYKHKTIVMLTYGEASLRGGEIAGCNVGDLEFDDRGCKLWIRVSKTKKRYVRLIDTEPYLREYINKEHQYKNNPEHPLFYSEQFGSNYGKRLNVNSINELLKRVAVKCGIKKRIFTHLGRHNSITHLKRLGMDSSLLAKRCGITLETLERVYLHSTDQDVDDAYLELKGGGQTEELQKIREEHKKLEAKKCGRCGKTNPATSKYCGCGMVLDVIEAERVIEDERKQKEQLIDTIKAEIVQELLGKMKA